MDKLPLFPLSQTSSSESLTVIDSKKEATQEILGEKTLTYFTVKLEENTRLYGPKNDKLMDWINEIFQESFWEKQEVSKGFKYIHEQFGMIVGGKLDKNNKPDLLNFTFFFKGGGNIVRLGGSEPRYTNLKKIIAEHKSNH